jgi:hypothetical protein
MFEQEKSGNPAHMSQARQVNQAGKVICLKID